MAVTESFQECLYGNTFTSYSDNNPLKYVLTTAKLDATRQRWISKLAKFNFMVYYHSGKSNVDADALSRISWDQNIKAEVVGINLKATVEGPDTLMEVYACHKCHQFPDSGVSSHTDDCDGLGLGPEGWPSY